MNYITLPTLPPLPQGFTVKTNVEEEPRFFGAKTRDKRTLIQFRGTSGDVRIETFKGREHVVIPVIALVEGVMRAENAPGAELVQSAVFSRTAQAWNGRPVVVNHPRRDGELVSANAPDVLEDEQLGTVFNAKMENEKLVLEAWVDRELATEGGDEKAATIDRAANGETVEVSVGAFVDVEERTGSFRGEEFTGRWTNVVPDHLAILDATKTGACSVADGCGTNRAASATCDCLKCVAEREATTEAIKTMIKEDSILDKALAAMKVATGTFANALSLGIRNRLTAAELSDVDKRSLLETFLSNENPNDWVFVIAVFDERIVYAQGSKLYQRSFAIEDDKIATFGDDRVEVTPRTDFIVVDKHDDDNDEEEDDMDKKEFVAGLIANPATRFEEADVEWLEGLDEDRLAKLAPELVVKPEDAAPAAPPEIADDLIAPAPEQTMEQYLEAAPADVRSVLEEGLSLQRAKKDHYVKALSDNPRNGFSKEELDGMDMVALERMVRLADLPDYSARSTSSIPEPAEDPNRAPEMPKVFDLSAKRGIAAIAS